MSEMQLKYLKGFSEIMEARNHNQLSKIKCQMVCISYNPKKKRKEVEKD